MFISQWWDSRGILQRYWVGFPMALSQDLAVEVYVSVSAEFNLAGGHDKTKPLRKKQKLLQLFPEQFFR